MKDYKRYIIAVGLLTVSFLYIFTSNETGVARIFVNLLTFAGSPSPSAFRVLMTPNAATSKRSDIWRTRDFHRAHSERHPDLQLQCDLTAVHRLMPPHQPSGREQY